MEQESYSPTWREKFSVRSFDIGLNARMRLSSVCSYLQEIAGKHATHLGVGYKFMQETGRVWVLSRLFINIHELPEWNGEFYAETWPLGTERIFFRRDYKIDDGRSTLITATSYWLCIDLNTRRPGVFNVETRRAASLLENAVQANKGKYAMEMPLDIFVGRGRDAWPCVSTDVSQKHPVVYSDIDHNRHVNNARYVEWIFNLFDHELLEKRTPSHFAIEYKHEVRVGDTVNLYMERLEGDKPAFAVEGRLEGNNQVCIRSKIIFS